jgi:hypothetical protein
MLRSLLVLLLLVTFIESKEYKRHNWKHWVDDDKNNFDTRQEVLVEENIADTLRVK